MKTYYVVVPTYGAPYIAGEETGDDDADHKTLSELVGGQVERTPFGYYTIHPMFCEEGASAHPRRWTIARQLLTTKQVRVYGNGNGMYECCPNVGMVITPKFYRGGPNGCPHSWGDEVLAVPEKVMKVLGITPEELSEKGHLPTEDEEEDEEEEEDE
jgi:hypothetical protein